jgi:hypothetical protein
MNSYMTQISDDEFRKFQSQKSTRVRLDSNNNKNNNNKLCEPRRP